MASKKKVALPKALDANNAAQLQRDIEVDVPPILEIDAIETAEDYSFADGLLSDIARKYDAAEAMQARSRSAECVACRDQQLVQAVDGRCAAGNGASKAADVALSDCH